MMNFPKSPEKKPYLLITAAIILLTSITLACSNNMTHSLTDGNEEIPTDIEKTGNAQEYYVFLIQGIDINSKVMKDGDFICIGEVPYSLQSECEYDGLVLPISGCVVTGHKETIDMLSPSNPKYMIDDKEISKTEFESIDSKKIQRVTFDADKVVIDTVLYPEQKNPYVPYATNEENRTLRHMMNKITDNLQNHPSVIMDGRGIDTKGLSPEEFCKKYDREIRRIRNVAFDGDVVRISTWPVKE